MSVTVYQLEHSPYCIPITRALAALGVTFATRNVSNADRREVIEITGGSYYQVPVISHDGQVIFESSPSSLDVARFLDWICSAISTSALSTEPKNEKAPGADEPAPEAASPRTVPA